MIQFEWPWMLLSVVLPWLAYRWLPKVDISGEAALRVPFYHELGGVAESVESPKPFVRRFPWWAALAWVLLTLASARPQWLGDTVELPVSGRDLMLAVDLSGSMEQQDFVLNRRQVDRLTATKQVAGAFIERRQGDRLGLILFGKQAYLQAPLTFDRKTVDILLQESAIGLAGKETAIGDAIGLAVKRFAQSGNDQQVLILLTDGANTAGEVEPLKAAQLAAERGLKIYTIGVGADEMLVRSLFGTRKINPSSDLDEKTLEAIATQTGGRYFRARDTKQLGEIYALLDELEPVEREAQSFRPKQALYTWPLAAALSICVLMILAQVFKNRRILLADGLGGIVEANKR